MDKRKSWVEKVAFFILDVFSAFIPAFLEVGFKPNSFNYWSRVYHLIGDDAEDPGNQGRSNGAETTQVTVLAAAAKAAAQAAADAVTQPALDRAPAATVVAKVAAVGAAAGAAADKVLKLMAQSAIDAAINEAAQHLENAACGEDKAAAIQDAARRIQSSELQIVVLPAARWAAEVAITECTVEQEAAKAARSKAEAAAKAAAEEYLGTDSRDAAKVAEVVAAAVATPATKAATTSISKVARKVANAIGLGIVKEMSGAMKTAQIAFIMSSLSEPDQHSAVSKAIREALDTSSVDALVQNFSVKASSTFRDAAARAKSLRELIVQEHTGMGVIAALILTIAASCLLIKPDLSVATTTVLVPGAPLLPEDPLKKVAAFVATAFLLLAFFASLLTINGAFQMVAHTYKIPSGEVLNWVLDLKGNGQFEFAWLMNNSVYYLAVAFVALVYLTQGTAVQFWMAFGLCVAFMYMDTLTRSSFNRLVDLRLGLKEEPRQWLCFGCQCCSPSQVDV